MTTTDERVRRLVRLYEATDPAVMVDGLGWYRNVRTWCGEVADLADLSLHQVVGMVAALSPVTPVDRNLQLAFEHACHLPSTGHPFLAKALAFRDEDAPFSILGNRKTRAFAESIMTAGTGNRVCFDTWAYRAMTGDIEPSRNGRHKHDDRSYKRYADNDKGYAEAERIYREAAAMVGRKPGNFQAITWCAVRGSAF
jgi:hypothetical protein